MAGTNPLYPLNLKLGVVEGLYEMLSALNNKGLKITPADVAYSDVKVDASHAEANTAITLTPIDGNKVVMGPALTRWYRRWALPELLELNDMDPAVDMVVTTTETPADLNDNICHALALTQLNKSLDANIDAKWTTVPKVIGTDEKSGLIEIVTDCPTLTGTVKYIIKKA